MIIILFSILAGVCGTGLGGLVTVVIGKHSKNMTGGLLAFAAGVMISVVCFGLLPESYVLSDIYTMILGLVLGIFVITLLNMVFDAASVVQQNMMQAKMLRSGLLMLIAIALHNIPEGIAIGAGGRHNQQLGAVLAIMIALHNIPEGMAVAAPLLAGGIGKGRVILLTALTGAPTLVGGLLGICLGNISDTAIAMSLSGAGGAMLYIVCSELIPQAFHLAGGKIATAISLTGVIAGLVISA